MFDLLTRLLDAQLDLGLGKPILWREIIGNGFGLASAVLGMRRRVSAWPIGILGNVILFTVFLGGVFHTPQNLDLWGQAGRQVFFLITSVYGWITWAAYRRRHEDEGVGVQPRWAGKWGLLQLGVGGVVIFVASFYVLRALGSWGPAADAWILTGSILATYGMARGWNEFWLIWIAVDIVGVPLLWKAQYYPSALMYVIYGAFVLWGFVTWLQVQRRNRAVEADAAHDQSPSGVSVSL
ncbi:MULTISPECIES: nicotinamide riboside transporter PnuC [Aestuariimicrobium]|uniref:nicotinamide riboside transporter PnuC n=1 Tax=Aestuariimicrobium TaxID=396388 RepID=UPI0003B37AFE|nr:MULTISPECIES: nicotinamide riboside transporter PnuC [Aestuariimicrobium]CAI9398593.1 Riboflavin/roseoflavin transporter RibM [Aestuariimicrobium sp. T2.26MG-19.2B]